MSESAGPVNKSRAFGIVLVAASLVIVSTASLVVYESLRSSTKPSSPVRTIEPSNPQCGRAPLVEQMQFQLTFNSTVSCFEGFPGWGMVISAGWVSLNGSVNLATTWSCVGLGCIVHQPATAYNATGSEGAFYFNIGSIGNQWENVSAIDFTFWASPADDLTGALHHGQQVTLVGVVS